MRLLLLAFVFMLSCAREAPKPAAAPAPTPAAPVAPAPEPAKPAPEGTTYTCPMHPKVTSTDAKAKCPICGMDLVPVSPSK